MRAYTAADRMAGTEGGLAIDGNLICLYQSDHRLHHRGMLGIEGNGDERTGVVFTDPRVWPLEVAAGPRSGRPTRGLSGLATWM